MVQVTFDTRTDSLEELEEAMRVLHEAIARKKGETAQVAAPSPTTLAPAHPSTSTEDTEIETPFLKISIKSDDTDTAAQTAPQTPTLNQLINDASLTEDELSKMFHQVQENEPKPKAKPKPSTSEASFIEIVEFDDVDEK